jgi:uncharacterized Tic20 family protein
MSENPIPSSPDDSSVRRISRLGKPADEAPRASQPADDEVVREYEERYTPRKSKREERMLDIPRSYSTVSVSDEERRWAAMAHGSAWLTLVLGTLTLGVAIPVTIFVPLAIYLRYRKQSDYVAFHALQAFTLQALGTVGAGLLAAVGAAIWGVGLAIALALVVVLVGFVLVPVWGLVGVVFGIAIALLPITMLLFSAIAAFEVYQGRDYRYPYIARWIDRQMSGGLMNA